jgi:energy-converting hydrogenase A subunit M
MDKYQDTLNGLLKVQVDNFLDIFSRIFLDSFYVISREISQANMTIHFQNKQFEADLKLLPSFETLYRKSGEDEGEDIDT